MSKTTKQQAGRRGGLATLERHGREHYRRIGKRGADVTWTRYQLSPVGLTEYALVERATGKIVKVIGR
jgi:general stress protein YciG